MTLIYAERGEDAGKGYGEGGRPSTNLKLYNQRSNNTVDPKTGSVKSHVVQLNYRNWIDNFPTPTLRY